MGVRTSDIDTADGTTLQSIQGLGTNVAQLLSTPSAANLRAVIAEKSGSGNLLFSNAPTLVAPKLGTPASGNLQNCTNLPPTRLAQTTSLTPAVNTLCKVPLSGANKSVQLPATHQAGDTIKVKMTSPAGGHHITINPHGVQTIDGALTRILSTSWASLTLESDGHNWLTTG